MKHFLLLVGAFLGVPVATATIKKHGVIPLAFLGLPNTASILSLRGGDDIGSAVTDGALTATLGNVDPTETAQGGIGGLNRMIPATVLALIFKTCGGTSLSSKEKQLLENMGLSNLSTGLTSETIGNGMSMAAPLSCRGGALIPARKRNQVPQKNKTRKDKHKSNVKPYIGTKLTQLNQWWYQAPEIVRFFVSGNLGNMCFFAIERAVYKGISNNIDQLPPFVDANKDSISFFLGYILQMGSQHLLHAWLVYGLRTINTREKYIKTLVGQSSAYFTAMIGSTVLNTFLRQRLGVPKNYALFGTLYLFAIINYFVVGWIVHRAVEKSDLEELELSKKKKSNPLVKMRGGATSNNINGGDILDFLRDSEKEPYNLQSSSVMSALLSNTYSLRQNSMLMTTM